jgi:hypothetical protein
MIEEVELDYLFDGDDLEQLENLIDFILEHNVG